MIVGKRHRKQPQEITKEIEARNRPHRRFKDAPVNVDFAATSGANVFLQVTDTKILTGTEAARAWNDIKIRKARQYGLIK
ncbi:hypothetical protein DUG50_22765 [Salmonella enterica subsp. enterica serovar Miami]|nr:hypothetical protein [Salmonella enterica subsp. enterica serovar Miami]